MVGSGFITIFGSKACAPIARSGSKNRNFRIFMVFPALFSLGNFKI